MGRRTNHRSPNPFGSPLRCPGRSGTVSQPSSSTIKEDPVMSRHARRLVAAITLTLALASIATGQVAAGVPRANERITFQRFDADGHWQIWVANPDLWHQRQITSG